jgi:hypothetical protein
MGKNRRRGTEAGGYAGMIHVGSSNCGEASDGRTGIGNIKLPSSTAIRGALGMGYWVSVLAIVVTDFV